MCQKTNNCYKQEKREICFVQDIMETISNQRNCFKLVAVAIFFMEKRSVLEFCHAYNILSQQGIVYDDSIMIRNDCARGCTMNIEYTSLNMHTTWLLFLSIFLLNTSEPYMHFLCDALFALRHSLPRRQWSRRGYGRIYLYKKQNKIQKHETCL